MQPESNTTEQLHDAFAQIISTHEDFVVDFDEAWQWIGFNKKQQALEMLEKNFVDGEEFSLLGVKTSSEKGGRPATHIMLTVDCFKAFCMLAQTEQGKQVRRYYIQLEKQLALAGSLGVAYQTGTPLEQRRELVAQLKTDKDQAKQLLGELLSQETYADYIRITDRINKIEKQLKSLDKQAVNQLNLLAEQAVPTLA